MSNILNFIDIQKYIYLQEFIKINNIPKDILLYITYTSIPFEQHIIDKICEKIIVTNKQGIFFCDNIFDNLTVTQNAYLMINNNLKYCIEKDGDNYDIGQLCILCEEIIDAEIVPKYRMYYITIKN